MEAVSGRSNDLLSGEKRCNIAVRTDGFFLPRNGCNIAPGTDPAMETVTEDFQNFSQRFSGADFCCRQTTASCTFVRQTGVCPTKVLALRGRVPLPSRAPLNLDIWKNSTKREKPVTSTRSGSMSSRISVSAGCLQRPDWNTTAAGLSSKESSTRSSSLSNATEDIVQIIQFPCFEFFNLWSYIVKQLN